jgi:hypothetical protein
MGNPGLRWERTGTLNFGVDFTMFNVLFGSIDVYNAKGRDIMGVITIPSVTGATNQRMNQAALYNRGFELELGVHTRITDNISFSTRVTYAYNENKITDLFFPSVFAFQMITGGVVQAGSTAAPTGFVQGFPVNSVWAYEWLGMHDGTPMVAGANGTPSTFNLVSIHNTGMGLDFLKYMGPAMDPHTLGWMGTFTSDWGVSLSFLFTGKFGGRFRNPTFNYNMLGSGKNIASSFIEFVGSDQLPSFPLPNNQQAFLWDRYTPNLNTMVESSSFIKLRELTLDYILPAKLTNSIGLRDIRMFVQVRDLGTLWVANSRGYDPEWFPGTMKPPTTFAFGLNIGL